MHGPSHQDPNSSPDDAGSRLFKSAEALHRANVGQWQQRASAILGHPVVLLPDVGPLEDDAGRIGPFVEMAIEGTLDALTLMQGDPALKPKLVGVVKIVIEPCPPGQTQCIASYGGGSLNLCIPIDSDGRPTQSIVEAVRVAVNFNAR